MWHPTSDELARTVIHRPVGAWTRAEERDGKRHSQDAVLCAQFAMKPQFDAHSSQKGCLHPNECTRLEHAHSHHARLEHAHSYDANPHSNWATQNKDSQHALCIGVEESCSCHGRM